MRGAYRVLVVLVLLVMPIYTIRINWKDKARNYNHALTNNVRLTQIRSTDEPAAELEEGDGSGFVVPGLSDEESVETEQSEKPSNPFWWWDYWQSYLPNPYR